MAELSKKLKKKPILVGGSAVELYTAGESRSFDIDLIADREELASRLKEMGFEKDGRFYRKEDLLIEVVGSTIGNKKFRDIELKDWGTIRVIGIEDLIVDRLCACKFWDSKLDCEQAKFLYKGYIERLNLSYLKKRAKEEDVEDTLSYVIKR